MAASPVAWHEEASYRLPVQVWRDVMDRYFPNSGWLRVSRDTIDALTRFKARRALPTWEEAFEQLLKEAGEEGESSAPDVMSSDPFAAARTVADAVLYEGYVLYPYRASARKNQLRWQFGVLAPPAYAAAEGSERSTDAHRGRGRSRR